jgi:hypothetical protein
MQSVGNIGKATSARRLAPRYVWSRLLPFLLAKLGHPYESEPKNTHRLLSCLTTGFRGGRKINSGAMALQS